MKTYQVALISAAMLIAGQATITFAAMPQTPAGRPIVSAGAGAGPGAGGVALKCPPGEVVRWEQTPAPGHYYCAPPPEGSGDNFDRGYLPPH